MKKLIYNYLRNRAEYWNDAGHEMLEWYPEGTFGNEKARLYLRFADILNDMALALNVKEGLDK